MLCGPSGSLVAVCTKTVMTNDLRFHDVPLVDAIIAFEEGEYDEETSREFLQWLSDEGVLQHLQGSYQRAYNRLCCV